MPTERALWLFGVDVALHWNQARCPQLNGVVERTQGVSKGWVEPHTCADAAELQQRLQRRVDRNGKVSVYDRGHWVGKPWIGHYLYVSLDPEARQWVLATADGREMRRCQAVDLTRAHIVGLRVSRPRGAAESAAE